MSDPMKKEPSTSKTVQVCMFIFVIIGVVGFLVVAPSLYPAPPGGGFNMERVMAAAVVGALFAAIGGGIGTLIDRFKK